MAVPRDVQQFLDGYPGEQDDTTLSGNIDFYSNQVPCRPNNIFIDDLHAQWDGQYDTLEYEHGFIQWLFPLPEHGMNYRSQPLQEHEAAAMRASPEILARVVRSYRLMLDFYGMQLVDEQLGLLERAPAPRDFARRYRNLVRSPHNYLRISRILKHLSIMGLEHLNYGFLLHVLSEQSEHGELDSHGIHSSMDRWWANCIRSEADRRWLRQTIVDARSGNAIFTRAMYLGALTRRRENGTFSYPQEGKTVK